MAAAPLRSEGLSWDRVAAALDVPPAQLREARRLCELPTGRARHRDDLRRQRRQLAERAKPLRAKGWGWPRIAAALSCDLQRLRRGAREAGLIGPGRDPKERRDAEALALYRRGLHVHAVAVRLGVADRTAKRAIRRALSREAGIEPERGVW